MNYKELSHEISKIRKEKRISQKTLSDDLEISRATISNFENSKSTDIGLKKVIDILDYLGLELCLKEKSAFPTVEELRDAR